MYQVRTPEEWIFTGHAPMAINVPVMFQAYVWDDNHNGFAWDLNTDFVQRVARGSRLPRRSSSPAGPGEGERWRSMPSPTGFTDVYNVIDGMEGDRIDDPDDVFHGIRVVNGWKGSGLPSTCGSIRTASAIPHRETRALYPGSSFRLINEQHTGARSTGTE